MITAEELKVQIGSGFGYSLSKEISDVDSNGLNDFAVGAPFGESAVLLRSRPVISFEPAEMFYPGYYSKVIDPEVVQGKQFLNLGNRWKNPYDNKKLILQSMN